MVDLPTGTLQERLVFVYYHFFDGDIQKAKTQLGVPPKVLKNLIQSKSLSERELNQILRGFGKHASISKHWLETGEGAWRRSPGNSLISGVRPKIPVPKLDSTSPLLANRDVPIALFLTKIAEEIEQENEHEQEVEMVNDTEELTLEEIELLTRPRRCTKCQTLATADVKTCPECGAPTEIEALVLEVSVPAPPVTPVEAPPAPPVTPVEAPPAPPAPPPAPPVAPSPFRQTDPTNIFESAIAQMSEAIQAAKEIRARDESSRKLAEDLVTTAGQIKVVEQTIVAALAAVENTLGSLTSLESSWKGVEDKWTERLAIVVQQVNKEVALALELAHDGVHEIAHDLKGRLARVSEQVKDLSFQIDNTRRDIIPGARLREIIREIVRSETQHLAVAAAAFDGGGNGDTVLLDRITELEEKLARETEERTGLLTRIVDLDRKMEQQKPVARKRTEESAYRPDESMRIAQYAKLGGRHQRFLSRTEDRIEMGKFLCAAYRLYKIVGEVDDRKLDINNGKYPIADMRHYIKWLVTEAGLEPRIEDWLVYFKEHALNEWSTRVGLDIPVAPEDEE